MAERELIIELPAMTYFDAAVEATAAEAASDSHEDNSDAILPPSMKEAEKTEAKTDEAALVEADENANNSEEMPEKEPGQTTQAEQADSDGAEPAQTESEPESQSAQDVEAVEPENEQEASAETEAADSLEVEQPIEQQVPAYIEYQSENASKSVAIIDTRVINYEQLVEAAEGDVILINAETSLDELNETLATTGKVYENIEIWAHATNDGVTLGEHEMRTVDEVEQVAEELSELASYAATDGAINFFGCNVAETDVDIAILDRVETVTDRTVRGSNNFTGEGGDFVLEYATDGSAGYESEVLAATELANVSTSLAFVSGGLINQHIYHQNNGNGSVTLIFNRAIDSSGAASRTWQEGENYAHAYSENIGGVNLTDWHLGEWASRAEYLAWHGSFSAAEYARFEGMIFAGFDQSGTERNVFNDNEGRRYGQQIGGTPAHPNNVSGADYANWDTTDTITTYERGVVIMGNRYNEQGQLHDTYNGSQSGHIKQDAVWIQNERIVGTPSTATTPTSVLIEQRENGSEVGSVNPFESTTIGVGSNAYAYQYAATASAWTAGQMTYTFDGSGVNDSVEAKFNVSINNNTGNWSITARSGQEPTAANMRAMLDGIELSITGSVDEPNTTNITGVGTFTTKDIFGQNVTMADTGNYTIRIEDRPDATPGATGSVAGRSGHDLIPAAYDVSNHPSLGDPADAHGIVIENSDQVYPWNNFELDSRDDRISSFRMIVDNPNELFEDEGVLRSDIVFDPRGNSVDFEVNLVHDETTNTAYYEFTPDYTSGIRPDDINNYLNRWSVYSVGENPDPARITFSYEWEDMDGNYETSIDGYIGSEPGADPDFGRTVMLILPVNDLPDPKLEPTDDPNLPDDHIGFKIEENGYSAPFDKFTLTDTDTEPGAARIVIDSGWITGDRELETASWIADNPKFDIAFDQSTGSALITVKAGETTVAADFENVIKSYQFMVADNQPDLTDITGYIRIYDEVDLTMTAVLAQNGDQYSDASFTIGIKDRIEVSAGAPGSGENTGHELIPDQIRTETFNELYPEGTLADMQAIVVENGEAKNPFDDAAFEHLQVGARQIDFEVVSGWLPDQSEWIIDYDAFANASIEVTVHADGSITFLPIVDDYIEEDDPVSGSTANAFDNFNEINPTVLADLLKAGSITTIVHGENVTSTIAVFRITAEDGHTLTETSLDTVNNVDADEDGLFRILQVGVNDTPVIESESASGEQSKVNIAIEAGETVYPLTAMSVSDIDSAQMQALSIKPDGDVGTVKLALSAVAQAVIDQYNVKISFSEGSGWILAGAMPIEEFNRMMQGVGFENTSNNAAAGATELKFDVIALDVSETGFNDDLDAATTAALSVVNTPEPAKPADPVYAKIVPPTPILPDPILPNRHVAEEDEIYLALLDPELPENDPINVHITMAVRGHVFELERQTESGSIRIIAKETQEVRDAVVENGIDRIHEILKLVHSVGNEEIVDTQEGRERAKSAYGLAH